MSVAGVVLGLLAVAWMALLCHARVRRLHRLHVRVDAARAGLDAALAQRAAAAAMAGVVVPNGVAPRAAGDLMPSAEAPGRMSMDGPARALPSSHWHPDVRAGAATPVPGSAGDPEAAANALGRGAAVDPEAAANALGRALARLDRATLPADVRAALLDAEQLLVLARRVHNDAVRDTLGLRSHRLVRWLRLAGTAPMPAYFEIADPAPALTYDRVSPSQE